MPPAWVQQPNPLISGTFGTGDTINLSSTLFPPLTYLDRPNPNPVLQLDGNPLPAENNDGVIASFRAQDQPIPRVLLRRSFQYADLTGLLRIQNIDGPVPPVLRSGRLGSRDRLGVRREDAHAFLGDFGRKDLYSDGRAGQPSEHVSLRCVISQNLKCAAPAELASPYYFSGGGTLIGRGGIGGGRLQRSGPRQIGDECHY